MQQLKGEALKSVGGYASDGSGYIASLKRLKYMFGNHARVAEATIKLITNGKQLPDSDPQAIADFYYLVSSCINTLRKMNYHSDIYSTHVLRGVISRLPTWMQRKWSEYSFRLRQTEESSLSNFEQWLQDRVMASKDPYLPQTKGKGLRANMTRANNKPKLKTCVCCRQIHPLYKCDTFKSKSSDERLTLVKKEKLCFNCLNTEHSVKDCKSRSSCFTTGCKRRHHTLIHDALSKRSTEKRQDSKESNKTSISPHPDSSTQTVGMVLKGHRKVYLQIVPVRVSNFKGTSVDTYALLDMGSQCTIITKTLCQALNLPGKFKNVNFGTIKDDEVLSSKIVNLQISSQDGRFTSPLRNVYSLKDENFLDQVHESSHL